MAESKNTFLKSKMNKDLDDRLMPPGEYRDARNISISRSEDADVGAIENVLGNELISNFANSCGAEVIGRYMDVTGDRIFVMLTNYTDNSATKLDNFSPSGALHYICSYNVITEVMDILVEGYFLNFSKTHPINHINLIEDLLFWTDNRNQPRKINVDIAAVNGSYYNTEDHISVAKYYPFQPIKLMKLNTEDYPTNVLESTMKNRTDKYLYNITQTFVEISDPQPGTPIATNTYDIVKMPVGHHANVFTNTTSTSGTGLAVDIFVKENPNDDTQSFISSAVISFPGNTPYINNDLLTILNIDGSIPDLVTYFPCQIEYKEGAHNPTNNPNYNEDWPGDPNFLKDKFARFSYRFKFEDNEYSLMAPFTQQAFIPKQDGYFMEGDEDKSYKSTEVGFFRNRVNDISLMIPSPPEFAWKITPIFTPSGLVIKKSVHNALKVKEIDILIKESDGLSVKVVETISRENFEDNNNLTSHNSFFEYNYKSQKAYKTLPEKDTIRVYDKTPIRAATQEVSGNRIIYGNYINKHTPPLTIDYNILATEKTGDSIPPLVGPREDSIIEYPNHTLKQNRTYQVGIILSDRYGRQSSVILSSQDADYSSFSHFAGSTLFHNYKDDFIIDPSNPNPLLRTWPGDSLKILFNSTITSTRDINSGAPGLYDEQTNPLGWHSYKIVVKQQEQDYYNIYFPGILNGSIFVTTTETTATPATPKDPTCYITLQGDNINKIPRDLKNVGPDQKIFRTNKPTKTENPLWYAVVDVMGNTKVAHFDNWDSPEAKAFIQTRNVELGLIEPKEVENASVELFPRVENIRNITTGYENKQFTPGLSGDVVTTIGTGVDLGLYPSTGATYPNEFYNPQSNPLYGELQVQDYTIGVSGEGARQIDGAAPKLPILAVYETEPEYSRLKLFWETTSSGLIEQLNSDIEETNALGLDPTSFENWENAWEMSDLNYENRPPFGEVAYLDYDSASGGWLNPPTIDNCRISNNFWVLGQNGNKITTNISISIHKVVNGNSTIIVDKFDIQEDISNPGEFFIYLTDYHWYSGNSSGQSDNFVFTFVVTHGAATVGFTQPGVFFRNIPPFAGYLDIKNMPSSPGGPSWVNYEDDMFLGWHNDITPTTSVWNFLMNQNAIPAPCGEYWYDQYNGQNCGGAGQSPIPLTGNEGLSVLWAQLDDPLAFGNPTVDFRSAFIHQDDTYRIPGGNTLADPEERWVIGLRTVYNANNIPITLTAYIRNTLFNWFCLPTFNGSYLNNSGVRGVWEDDNFPRLHEGLEITVINQKRIESNFGSNNPQPDNTPCTFFFISSNWKVDHGVLDKGVNGSELANVTPSNPLGPYYFNTDSGNITYPYAWLQSQVLGTGQGDPNNPDIYIDDLFEVEVEWRDATGGGGGLSTTATFYCRFVETEFVEEKPYYV